MTQLTRQQVTEVLTDAASRSYPGDLQAFIAALSGLIQPVAGVNVEETQYNVQNYGAVGDGQTDDSLAFVLACAAARANNCRSVYLPYTPAGYSVPNLTTEVGNVSFSGPGFLIQAPWKSVIPSGPRASNSFGNATTCTPAIHLRAFGRALVKTVCVIGDSTTVGGGASTVLDFLYPALMEKIRRDNPGHTIVFRNLSVGGKTWLNLPTASLTTEEIAANPDLAATGLTSSSPWLDFAEFYAPDLLIINCGTNGADGTNPFRINDALVANANAVATWAKQPSIILVTPNPRGECADLDRSNSDHLLSLNDRAFSAGSIRSYAEFNGLGYIDLFRFGSMAKDGVDVINQYISRVRQNQTLTWPVSLEPTTDGEITFTLPNPQGCFVEQVGGANARQLEIAFTRFSSDSPTVPVVTQSIRFGWGGSTRWRYQVLGQSGVNTTGVVTTSTNLLTTPQTVRVSWKGNHLKIDIAGTEVFNGLWYRGGGIFSTVLQFVSSSAPFTFTLDEYKTSQPIACQPAVTDLEFYGLSSGNDPTGGNGINHPASRGINASVRRAVEAANFCGAAAGVILEQPITAAAAIDTRAGYVRLTGPAAGSYAITLAAPGPLDIGRLMHIEMASTTGANTVTLSLANVVGGTASTTCTWNAARQSLTVIGQSDRWRVINQGGVTLT